MGDEEPGGGNRPPYKKKEMQILRWYSGEDGKSEELNHTFI